MVANLSRFAQCTWIDLGEFKGARPVEMLGRAKFPTVGDGPYCLTLGPYAFYWFLLPPQTPHPAEAAEAPAIGIASAAGWEAVFRGKGRQRLEDALPAYLQGRRWFQGRMRTLKTVCSVRDTLAVPREGGPARVALVQADYAEGDPEPYLLPLAFHADGGPESRPGAPFRWPG